MIGTPPFPSGDSPGKIQARIVRLLVERVDISDGGADVRLRVDGLSGLVRDLGVRVAA